MKTTLKTLVALLAVAACALPAAAQSIAPIVISGSTIKQYPSLKGTKEIIRSSDDNNYSVTCGYSADRRSFFIVKNGNTARSFYASAAIDPIAPHGINNYGHEILDMVMDGATCWVCGRYWYETGELGYTIEGNAFWMTEEKGFIGKFDARSAVNGSCTFYTYPVSGTDKVSSIASGGGSVAFIADDGVYAAEAVPLNDSTLSLTKVTPPFNANEVFMDVTYTGSKHVFLSRFDIPNSVYRRYRIGLRYVSPGDIANMQTMHVYDIWTLLGPFGMFNGLDPVHICATNSGNGVAVAWLETNEENPYPEYLGHLFALKIDSEGSIPFWGFYSTDDAVYTKIKDIGFGNLPNTNPYMTVLLEDGETRYIYGDRVTDPTSHEVHSELRNKTVKTETSHAVKRVLTPSVVLPVNKCSM